MSGDRRGLLGAVRSQLRCEGDIGFSQVKREWKCLQGTKVHLCKGRGVSPCVWLESRSSGGGGESQGRRIGQKMHLIGVSSYPEGNARPLMKLGGDRMMSLFLQ